MSEAIARPGRIMSWELELCEYVTDALAARFEWGSLDCCLWAAGWVQVCTGYHPARDLIGTYGSALGARRALEREGGFTAMVSKRMRQQPLAQPYNAARGDLAALPGLDGARSLGIVLGARIGALTPEGFVRLPILYATHAWRVG